MRTIRRLIYGELFRAVAFITVGFMALFTFFDLIDELPDVGRIPGYQLHHALLFTALRLPSYLYELLPITLLIGAIYVMARLAQSSEYTILRTSGLGPRRALLTLLGVGAIFMVLTFAVGDYVVPAAERAGQLVKGRIGSTSMTTGLTGAWLKERREGRSYTVNVGRMAPDGTLQNVSVFEFDERAHLISTARASQGTVRSGQGWLLRDVQRREFIRRPTTEAEAAAIGHALPDQPTRVETRHQAEWLWPTQLSADMVATAVLRPDRMPIVDLFTYVRHLEANGQSAQRYKIEFWRNLFYPLSCLVMVVLALPFAYLHFRSGNITSAVFGGVMAGISFFLLNNVFGFAGNLNNWAPWLTAAAPSLIYTAISLLALRRLVLRQ